jgi:hypothetical protein
VVVGWRDLNACGRARVDEFACGGCEGQPEVNKTSLLLIYEFNQENKRLLLHAYKTFVRLMLLTLGILGFHLTDTISLLVLNSRTGKNLIFIQTRNNYDRLPSPCRRRSTSRFFKNLCSIKNLDGGDTGWDSAAEEDAPTPGPEVVDSAATCRAG